MEEDRLEPEHEFHNDPRRRREAADRVREVLTEQYGSLLEAKARELVERNEVRIDAGGGAVSVRLVRFRNGAVLEHKETFPGHGTGHGMVRIERSRLSNPVPLLAGYLQNSLVSHWDGSGSVR